MCRAVRMVSHRRVSTACRGPQQYNAVKPPPSLVNGTKVGASAPLRLRHVPGIAKTFTIQTQMAKKKATGPAHNAFAPAAPPAYTKACFLMWKSISCITGCTVTLPSATMPVMFSEHCT